jgi:hypothetical protein
MEEQAEAQCRVRVEAKRLLRLGKPEAVEQGDPPRLVSGRSSHARQTRQRQSQGQDYRFW